MFKRLFAVLVMIVFFANSAMADNNKKAEKKSYHKWWYLAAAPVYYFVGEIPLHEGSHAFAIWLNPNYSEDNFKPWPHGIGGGHFVLGSVDAVCYSEAACNDKTGAGVIAAAPYLRATLFFAAADALLSTHTVKPDGVAGRVLYVTAMLVPWWDFSYNAVWSVKGSDFDNMADSFQIKRWKVVSVGLGVSAVGLWRLWKGYKRAFPSHRHSDAKESSLIIVPTGDSETAGLLVSLRF